MPIRLGVIGLGNMGRPIAENLLRAGYSTTVFDLRSAAVEALCAAGAQAAPSPAALAGQAEMILIVVPDSAAVRQVLSGKGGVARGATRGSVVVDMTTGDPQYTKPMADRLATKGIAYLDAPMTGGGDRGESRTALAHGWRRSGRIPALSAGVSSHQQAGPARRAGGQRSRDEAGP